jgi:hypothetical protein
MSKKRVDVTGDVMSLLDPMKTAKAIGLRQIPPLICLACINSGESGICTQTGVDVEEVRVRWEQQSSINQTSFQESLKPDTPLVDICVRFQGEVKKKQTKKV